MTAQPTPPPEVTSPRDHIELPAYLTAGLNRWALTPPPVHGHTDRPANT